MNKEETDKSECLLRGMIGFITSQKLQSIKIKTKLNNNNIKKCNIKLSFVFGHAYCATINIHSTLHEPPVLF